MSKQQIEAVEDQPTQEHHEGGFRPIRELGRDNTRGGVHYGELIEQVRGLMDRVRLADPSDELGLEVIATLKELNAKLDEAVVDEWNAPSWHRNDLPARGNITLPPFLVDSASTEGVRARITFRTFHLGGNSAAHGGHIALGFDDLLGMTAAIYTKQATRTAFLHVDYRSITPLNTELRVHGWVERQEGRKVFVRATLHDGDRLCAEAHGLFVLLKPGQQ
ncbi:PaaI family thioesterase [Nocardia yunnanensis]|uniref:Acyl-coenzyme A thioesterase THEM4 n=1 Tax=Nocardia yunnanensis TaxID=2382165 RepID=A0A386Z9K2_9NOCA|nr:PaaI family thioesterase [Nocardia yunnanensis]AYF74341.1 PaaI family thioesterase [Nocardia yunnanensis]